MKTAIVGCGAMGSLLGAKLVKAGKDVSFIDPWQENVDKINKDGLYMENGNLGDEGKEFVKIPFVTTNPEEVGPVDAIIFLVKGTKTEETMKKIQSIIKKRYIYCYTTKRNRES